MIQFRLEWSVLHNQLCKIKFSPVFAEVIPDNHQMIISAASGDLDNLRILIKSKDAPRPSSVTVSGWTPLHYAAAAGHDEVCRLLLQHGASTDRAGIGNVNALHVAAHFGRLQVFRTLLNAGGDLDSFHDHGMNPLFELLVNQRHTNSAELDRFIHWLIRGQEQYLVDTEAEDNEGRSILHYLTSTLQARNSDEVETAILDAYRETISRLVSEGADLDAKDVYGSTLLHYACKNGWLGIALMLLKSGCEVEIRDTEDYTALRLAVINGHYETLQALIDFFADVEAIAEPLDKLPSYHHDLMVATPLSLCAVNGDVEMFEILRKHGVCENNGDLTAILNIAVNCNNVDFVQNLLEYENSKLRPSKVLWCAKRVDMIEVLVRGGARPDGDAEEDNDYGWKPLPCAVDAEWLAGVKRLLELRADANIPGRGGWTALHFAAKGGREDIVDILLLYGANPDHRDNDGFSPLDRAKAAGNVKVVRRMQQYGNGKFAGSPQPSKNKSRVRARAQQLENI